MEIQDLLKKLENYRNSYTDQYVVMDDTFEYENDFIKVIRVDCSNKAGGENVRGGKQWSIICDIKKSFTNLNHFLLLRSALGGRISVTPVSRGSCKGYFGIRIYDMAKAPTQTIIYDLLHWIFD